jgi:hypothetical protein
MTYVAVSNTDLPYHPRKLTTDEEDTTKNNKEENKLNSKIISNLALKTKPGTNDYGFTKTNQDNYIMAENIFSMDNYSIFGVLDGHGINFIY